MAARFPLIANSSSNQIQELASVEIEEEEAVGNTTDTSS